MRVVSIESSSPYLPQLLELEKAVFSEVWGESGFMGHFLHGGRVLALIDEEKCVGFCAIKGVLDQWELYKIGVISACRRRGGAQMLLRKLEIEVQGTLFLEVRKTNYGAQKFYENEGFKNVGERKGYYRDGESAMLYQKIV